MRKALVIERDGKLARYLVRLLGEQGFIVDMAPGAQGFAQAAEGIYDLVLMDVDLLDVCAVSALRALRDRGQILPILAIGPRKPGNASMLLRAGADDYVAKPFEVEELIARIHAAVRRPAASARLRVGPLEIDRIQASAKLDGHELRLSVREFAVLTCLASRGSIVTKRELLTRFWDDANRSRASNIVEVTISRLRERLGDSREMIETIRGVGYRFVESPPRRAGETAIGASPVA